jgi:hypothetical protein
MNILVRALAITQDPDTKMLLLRQIEHCIESKTIGVSSLGSMTPSNVGRESLSRSASPPTRDQRGYRNRSRSPEVKIHPDLEVAHHRTG